MLLALAVGLASPTHASELTREADVKAALLYNFTQFVQWPPASFEESGGRLVIGILGRDPFGSVLDDLVAGETVNGHPIEVARCRDVAQAARAHVLFISASERGRLPGILAELQGRPVMTIGDFDGFLEAGGAVQLYRNAQNKIRVRVNLPAARAAHLTLSAKLLRVVELGPASGK
ncbi:MAG TPA: YfiR family protein [Opitutus sp.]|nr:YfiR family protein [Opitutus sp.]